MPIQLNVTVYFKQPGKFSWGGPPDFQMHVPHGEKLEPNQSFVNVKDVRVSEDGQFLQIIEQDHHTINLSLDDIHRYDECTLEVDGETGVKPGG